MKKLTSTEHNTRINQQISFKQNGIPATGVVIAHYQHRVPKLNYYEVDVAPTGTGFNIVRVHYNKSETEILWNSLEQ